MKVWVINWVAFSQVYTHDNEMSTQRLHYVVEFCVCTVFISLTPQHHLAYHTERQIHEGVGYQLGGLLPSLHP
jgi:hypothetical protein